MSGWESAWAKLEGRFFSLPRFILMPTNAISTLRSRPPPSRHIAAHKIGFCSCNPSAPRGIWAHHKTRRTNKWFDDCAKYQQMIGYGSNFDHIKFAPNKQVQRTSSISFHNCLSSCSPLRVLTRDSSRLASGQVP